MENKEGIQKIVSVLCSVFSIEKKMKKASILKTYIGICLTKTNKK